MLLFAILFTFVVIIAAMLIVGTILDIDWMEAVGLIGLTVIGAGSILTALVVIWHGALTQ